MKKIILTTFVMVMIFSLGVNAYDYNKYASFSFTANAQKKTSVDTVKPVDGDPRCYITTLASLNGTTSNVFSQGGTYYARSRWAQNSTLSYSHCITFTSNRAGNALYDTGSGRGIYYGETYCQWGEVENVISFPAHQATKWCP